jgi:uncharacterized membrane protein YecN with MAPEG domain
MSVDFLPTLSRIDLVPKFCVAVLTLLFFGLSLAITFVRLRTKTLFFGAPADPTSVLTKLVRAHGNTAEYVGLLALLILSLGVPPRPHWVTGLMLLAVAARLLFVYAMLRCGSLEVFDPLRAVAVTGTYVAGLGLGAALLVS